MNKPACCLQTIIAVRNLPSERAELVTQLLFGETYRIIETAGNWIYIKTTFDSYEGWIDKKLLFEITEDQLSILIQNKTISAVPLNNFINKTTESTMPLVAGSNIPLNNKNNGVFEIGNKKFEIPTPLPNIDPTGKSIVNLATLFLNAPYLWGGRTILGIDCSGLTQVAYKIIGIQLPRDASKQVEQGKTVNFIDEGLPGDLAFFDNAEGQITHVGLLMDNRKIIHASGFVRIDKIDHQGIYCEQRNAYTHKLRVIKRIL